MYAIIKTGGKQYRVSEGQSLRIEKCEAEPGSTIEFSEVLMLNNGETSEIGTPTINGAKVSAEVVTQGRHKKVRIIKFKRRKHHMKQQGHRQYFTQVKINKIQAA